MKRTMNKKGFTIVELVIVIAVIAILAAVLIPTFSGIVGKATVSSAVQQARSTLTNALAMSSTAQLPGKTAEGKYQTVFVLNSAKSAQSGPDFVWGYNGNALEDVAVAYDEIVKTQLKTVPADGFNAILTGAEAIKKVTNTTTETVTDASGEVTVPASPSYELDAVTEALIKNAIKADSIILNVDDAGNAKVTAGTNTYELYTSVDIATNIIVLTKFGK